MKKFLIQLEHESVPTEVTINKRYYNNGRIALEILNADENSVEFNFPYAVATVNMPDVLLEENEVLIKDYTENEGVLKFLVENNIVYATERGVESGFVWLPLCILRPEDHWGNNTLEPPPDKIDSKTGRCMWNINDSEVWAYTYKEALELITLIES